MKNLYKIIGDECHIFLTQGQMCVIDVADMKIVGGFRWCATKHRDVYYARTSWYRGKGKSVGSIELHKLIMGEVEDRMVDHRDRDTLNNKRSNLRQVTRAENSLNAKARKSSRSKYVGVTLEPSGKWRARVQGIGSAGQAGYYVTEIEAGIARAKVFVKHYGEEANLEQTRLATL